MPDRYNSLQNWLTEILGTSVFNLKPASEDASFRTYHRLFLKNKTFIVMDAPPEQENCKAFIKITKKLRACYIYLVNYRKWNKSVNYNIDTDLYLNKLDDFHKKYKITLFLRLRKLQVIALSHTEFILDLLETR